MSTRSYYVADAANSNSNDQKLLIWREVLKSRLLQKCEEEDKAASDQVMTCSYRSKWSFFLRPVTANHWIDAIKSKRRTVIYLEAIVGLLNPPNTCYTLEEVIIPSVFAICIAPVLRGCTGNFIGMSARLLPVARAYSPSSPTSQLMFRVSFSESGSCQFERTENRQPKFIA